MTLPDIGTIAVLSWSWNDSGRGVGGHGAGRVSVNDVTMTSELGSHSAALSQATATGTPLGMVVLEATKDGKRYMRIKLHDAVLSAYQVSGGAGPNAKPHESWTLNASKTEWEVLEQATPTTEPAAPPG